MTLDESRATMYGIAHSNDVTSQLPVERIMLFLMKICITACLLIRSGSGISQVNHYIRISATSATESLRGIVYYAWYKNQTVQSWQQGKKV